MAVARGSCTRWVHAAVTCSPNSVRSREVTTSKCSSPIPPTSCEAVTRRPHGGHVVARRLHGGRTAVTRRLRGGCLLAGDAVESHDNGGILQRERNACMHSHLLAGDAVESHDDGRILQREGLEGGVERLLLRRRVRLHRAEEDGRRHRLLPRRPRGGHERRVWCGGDTRAVTRGGREWQDAACCGSARQAAPAAGDSSNVSPVRALSPSAAQMPPAPTAVHSSYCSPGAVAARSRVWRSPTWRSHVWRSHVWRSHAYAHASSHACAHASSHAYAHASSHAYAPHTCTCHMYMCMCT